MAASQRRGKGPFGERREGSPDAAAPPAFLDAMDPVEREALLDVCRVVEADREERLLAAGADAAAILMTGAAHACASTGDGHTVVITLVEAGRIWGLTATLGAPGVESELTAALPSMALLTTGRDLRRLVVDRPGIARAVLEAVLVQLKEVDEETVRFASTSASQRVVYRIMELAARWGREADGRVEVDMPLTQDELASWSRTSRESAAKALHSLRDRRIISTGRRRLCVLDPDRLAALVSPRSALTARNAVLRRRAEDSAPNRQPANRERERRRSTPDDVV